MDKYKVAGYLFEILVLVAIMGIVGGSGCVDDMGFNDQDVIDEYNMHIDTWNRDVSTYTADMDNFNDALDDYNNEVEIYNTAYFNDGKALEVAEEHLNDAQLEYKYNAMVVRGRLTMFHEFLYANRGSLERNGVDVQYHLNGINDWIAEIDYNVQFAGI